MNLARLAKLFADLRADLCATAARIDEVDAELLAIKGQSDPFARHVFDARRKFRELSASDTTKHARRVEFHVEQSYKLAVTLGYCADLRSWRAVLDTRQPTNSGA